MAALSCDCGKFLLSTGKFMSRFSISLGSTELTWSHLWQKRFHTSQSIQGIASQPQRKKRDRLTVLKALASTVEHVPNKPDYRFIDDLVLNPRSLMKQKELFLALDAGEKAADYVLQKHPYFFPLREPVPAWPEKEALMENMDVSVENMKLMMRSGENVAKVVEWYKELCRIGEISINMHNEVLDFVSFHAVPGETQSNREQVEQDEKEDATKSKWRDDLFAEHLFHDLKDKGNSRTYEVFILGLLKHGEIFRAFKIYQEQMEKNLSGSLYLYNALLSHVCDAAQGDRERWDLVQDIVSAMQKDNIQPDVVTFNSLLAIAVEREEDARTLCHNLLRDMKKMKIAPSLGSYYYILFADRKNSMTDIAALHAILRDLNSGIVEYVLQHPSDLMFFHSAMDLARFKRNSSIAKELLDIVQNNGLKHLLGIRSSSFFGNYLCAIARNSNNVEYLYEEYKKLVPKMFVPRDWVMQQLFFAMRNNNDPQRVPQLYSDMVSMRIPFTERGVLSLFSAMKENIPRERASEFLFVVNDAEKWMDIFRISKTQETMSVSIHVSCLCGKHEEVQEKLEECNRLKIVPSEQAMHSVLQLNTSEGNNQGALSTLKLMADYKMKISKTVERIISETHFLSEKSEKIKSWFDIPS